MNPLTELKGIQQEAGDHRRRWFSSIDMDLVVWSDKGGAIVGFELYYDKNVREHVFIWRAKSGYAHLAVDDGEQKPVLDYKQAPILIPDGHIDINRIQALFDAASSHVPAGIVTLVRQKLTEHSGHGP